MDRDRYVRELRSSGMIWVIAGFGALAVINAATFIAGRDHVLSWVNANPLGAVMAVTIYDTPWTIAGLVGLMVLFAPVVFGTPVSARRGESLYFVVGSILVGVVAGVLWDRYFDNTGVVGAGSSGVAIAGQGMVFGLALLGLVRLGRQDTRRLGRMSSYWWYSFMVIYLSLILTTLWFVVFLQPIFTPTLQYNWRVHEFAFLMAVSATMVYGGLRWSPLGLDGKVVVDEMLVNFRFDDLNDRFERPLPKLRVDFAALPDDGCGEFDPKRREILLPESLKGTDYSESAGRVEEALLHAMVHAELYYSNRPWVHGASDSREGFDSIAADVGARPEP